MILCFLALAHVVSPPGTRVDRVIAVVDREVITESELHMEARVALALRKGGSVASAELPADLLKGMLDYLINQVLIAEHAHRAGGINIEEQQIDRRLSSFSERFGSRAASEAFRRRFGITRTTLRRIIRRDLRNEVFVRDQMRARMLTSSDDADYKKRYEQALSRWLGELRALAEIRLVTPEGNLEVVHGGEDR